MWDRSSAPPAGEAPARRRRRVDVNARDALPVPSDPPCDATTVSLPSCSGAPLATPASQAPSASAQPCPSVRTVNDRTGLADVSLPAYTRTDTSASSPEASPAVPANGGVASDVDVPPGG